MLRTLRDKLTRLVRGDDGVALVTTLAAFMFMYLVCIGVYAVGAAVKTRIHLQNACDAAAYSAAVVQADTISRIATINRAMSWTYAQMTRRQMDYIVYKWLKHTVWHYDIDRNAAQMWYLKGTMCPQHSWWKLWPSTGKVPIGNSDSYGQISLNDARVEGRNSIESVADSIVEHLPKHSQSFFNLGSKPKPGKWTVDMLEKQIGADKAAIRAMNNAEIDLANNLSNRIEKTVNKVLEANIPFEFDGKWKYYIAQSADPLSDYFAQLQNDDNGERRFLSFHDAGFRRAALDRKTKTVEDEFQAGINEWFVYGDGSRSTKSAAGIQRSYRHWDLGKLFSSWKWSAAFSTCIWHPQTAFSAGYWEHFAPVVKYGSCSHAHEKDSCPATEMYLDYANATHRATCYGDNGGVGSPIVWDELSHVGEKAQPQILKKDYFGKKGTITVALACANQNPWLPVFQRDGAIGRGDAIGGIFSAFNIGDGINPLFTVCLASAKAGYKYLDDDAASRNYRIDWSEGEWNTQYQSWNLCQSDWDAVLIPVRRAQTIAESGIWKDDVGKFLNDYLENITPDTSMSAGGKKLDVADFYKDKLGNLRKLGEEYRFGNESGFWGGVEIKPPKEKDKVGAKWNVGHPSEKIEWDELQKVMLH